MPPMTIRKPASKRPMTLAILSNDFLFIFNSFYSPEKLDTKFGEISHQCNLRACLSYVSTK
jgi:hypothetical protein